jgi:C-3',4' desaturase CrtD
MMYDVIVIGSGFGSLTAAALLAKRGLKVCVLEQAKYPGGCASSYKRKGYWFETGATTLVGLDEHMPLRYLLQETGIEASFRKLDVPMQVNLPNGQILTRCANLNDWINEAERVFGNYNQRAFWEHCYKISKNVWRTSLKQLSFPFTNTTDFWQGMLNMRPYQLQLLPGAFRTMQDMLRRYSLEKNQLFVDFVNEQLLITAQNYASEVNELFGATALCYTLYGNYYVDGGLINLSRSIESYLKEQGADIYYRHKVQTIVPVKDGYKVNTSGNRLDCRFVICGLPLNNTQELFLDNKVKGVLNSYILPSDKLNGAFTMTLVLNKRTERSVLHYQVHVPEGLPVIWSRSFFVSFSHPEDLQRAPEGQTVVSISAHISDPAATIVHDKQLIAHAILTKMEEIDLLRKQDIIYLDSATPGAWIFWTHRAFGMVGGYPQYQTIKPWQMKDARLDHKGAYICGDTVYPGQGIPGTCLSGIIAAHKLVQDHF